MSRVYNFSAGPAVLPEEVLKEAAAEMLDYNGTGMSVMEMSHRSKAFEEIIRTAEAAGAHGVVIPKRRSASLTLTVGKTSAGAASWLPVARVPNLASAMETLKKNGVWIYGTDAAGTSYTDADFTGGTAFVIGSEGFGMSRLVSEKCDAMLSLPMRGKVNSLNASVAAGIFMYEAVRQRLAK